MPSATGKANHKLFTTRFSLFTLHSPLDAKRRKNLLNFLNRGSAASQPFLTAA